MKLAIAMVLGLAVGTAAADPKDKPKPAKTADGDELYAQALAAFQASDFDRALELAMRAAQRPGSHRRDAQILYGDTLYKRDQYQRAKDIYVGLRKQATGDARSVLTRKIAACNKALSLPETDGITD